MKNHPFLAVAALVSVSLPALLLLSQAAPSSKNKPVVAETEFTIPKEEPHTTYTHRENWAHPRTDYFTTTQRVDKDGGRFDSSKVPTGDWVGTATAVFKDLPPGSYVVEVYYRQTKNRSSKVPWTVETDGQKNSRASGVIDQFLKDQQAGRWHPLKETTVVPLDVRNKLVLVWGSDQDNGRRSISYGGARVRRVQ